MTKPVPLINTDANRSAATAATMPAVTTPIDTLMMQRALAQAREAGAMDEVPVGAVVYRGHEVLAAAHNLRESQRDPTAHAEIVALRGAAQRLGTWRLTGCSIAVTLEPCPMCAGALVNARIERVVYGCVDPKMGCVDTLHRLCTDTRFNHRLEVVSGLLAEECGLLLTEFFERRRGRASKSVRAGADL